MRKLVSAIAGLFLSSGAALADTTLSQRNAATALTGAEFLYTIQNGTLVKSTPSQIKDYVNNNLRVFSSTQNGVVPPSGGGQVNFLRADGVWAALFATPAGSNGQLQFNNAGAFGGTNLAGDCTFTNPNLTCSAIGGKAVTLAGALTTSGAFALTLTTTAATNVTLPTTGTLATTAQIPGVGAGLSLSAGNIVLGDAAGVTYDGTNKQLTLAGGTHTTNLPVLTVTQTWNNVATTFNAMVVNVTNTTSAAGSALLDLQVGGASKFAVDVNGYLLDNVHIPSANTIDWNADTFIRRVAANVVGLRNSTTAQEFRIYKSWDGTNDEWAALDYNAGNASMRFGDHATGTGSFWNVELSSPNANIYLTGQTVGVYDGAGNGKWLFTNSSGDFSPQFNNLYSIGSGGNKPKNIYTGTSLETAGHLSSSNPTTVTTATYTVLETDSALVCNGAATITLTLPAAATFPGRLLNVQTYAAFTVVSASANVIPVAGGAAGTAILAATAGKYAKLKSNGTNWVTLEAN